MAQEPNSTAAQVLSWYAKLRPLTVDVVGDFAGRELFLVNGESLLRYCLEDSRVDYDGGFQLLHAVYAVEKFLSDMHRRGCNFDIIFFTDLRGLCIPPSCTPANAYKYILTRLIVIRHLSNVDQVGGRAKVQVHEFESVQDEQFQAYARKESFQFILCHEGDEIKAVDATAFRYFIRQIISLGRNVAIINNVRFMSSKMFAPLISGTNVKWMQDLSAAVSDNAFVDSHDSSPYMRDLEESTALGKLDDGEPAWTLRDNLCVRICRAVRGVGHRVPNAARNEASFYEMIQAFLVHVSMLQLCPLSERHIPRSSMLEKLVAGDGDILGTGNIKEATDFVQTFGDIACQVLERKETGDGTRGPLLNLLETQGLVWDLYDLVDGRLFLDVLRRIRENQAFPKPIVARARLLIAAATAGIDDYSLELNVVPQHGACAGISPAAGSLVQPCVLEFSHPILDTYLGDINLGEAAEEINSASDIVFRDLTHWHNSRNSTLAKTLPARKGFFAKKRHQKLMADVEAYSASLTNAQGRVLRRETIVNSSRISQSTSSRQGPNERAPYPPCIRNGEDTKNNKAKQNGQKNHVSSKGKARAHETAKAVQESKAEKQRDEVIRHWASTCATLEKGSAGSLISRYLKAQAFALGKSALNDRLALGSEVELYQCHILGSMWAGKASIDEDSKHLIAICWNLLQTCSKQGSVKPAVAQTVKKITTLLGAPTVAMTVGTQKQELCFNFNFKPFEQAGEHINDYTSLQLEFGGPYMDRRFGSEPDTRVRFEPDAWQRKVLDSIDCRNSLFVVAPTSAGKTFISFYAMKKVLEESDDSVLVYVAPTKALVNQIAAEINAHYSKSYHGKAGKSVYGVHTRDYRINSPTGCQILVTVPHMLQIMLLSPENATGPNAWSKRIKTIIFDEVHCIGQSEDGVVWEQLLLMAPCPIIALSATVGNPKEFCHWLEMSQAKKGFKIDMIVHDVRYSELRKFFYEGTSTDGFEGLQKQQRIPTPGLDEGQNVNDGLQFIHPVAALGDRNIGALKDMNFEARDSFTLWKEMNKLLTREEMAFFAVPDPYRLLPDVISKSDVVQWEALLKKALYKLMDSEPRSFQKIRSRLNPSNVAKSSTRRATEGKSQSHTETLLDLACDLHRRDALPALIFNYDRVECEKGAERILMKLTNAENDWKVKSPNWCKKLHTFEEWKKAQAKKPARAKMSNKLKTKDGDADKMSKIDIMRSEGEADTSQWESFDPSAPLEQFSFADHSKLQRSEFEDLIVPLEEENLKPWMAAGLLRGIAAHHAGLNRRYRQVVEILFRKGYLRLVIATGTLALGINMPCKTVVFSGDSIFLTAQNYRQASGRAGRRGFDLLGNVVFNGIPLQRVYEIMSSRLPDLRGQFPVSTTLVLRLLGLLHGTDNSDFAVDAVNALLSQTRLYLGGPEPKGSVKHHVRFSIEYLRRQGLLSAKGEPLNFSGLVGHLYFTENSVFAFHSLLKGGYFHQLCAGIDRNPMKTMLEMVLVLSHLFCRISVKRTEEFAELVHRSSSVVFLPRLPEQAEKLLAEHNRETLTIFKGYVHSYINSNLRNEPDNVLPFTEISVGGKDPVVDGVFHERRCPSIRSQFVALSGFTDDFKLIHELCSTVRAGVFLEESAIPYIPIWPLDTDIGLNAYIYDFYKHGSLEVLVRDNGIKRGNVWFHLRDFSLILAAIITSLESIMKGDQSPGEGIEEDYPEDYSEDMDENMAVNEAEAVMMAADTSAAGRVKTQKKKIKAELKDAWDDSESDSAGSEDETTAKEYVTDRESGPYSPQGGLTTVLKAFALLKEDFDTKFKKVWA